MKIRVSIGCLALLALAGCGGDERKPEVLTGTLQVGGVQGLAYVTATQSGTTDAAGTFHYAEGERVYFSIGGVVLGGAAGASQISLFSLAGQAPPTTERTLRAELDRASRQNRTSFVRAMNTQRLLMALDADHDPRNGYDLRGRGSELAGATLDIDQGVMQFDRSLNRLSPVLTRNLPLWAPVVWLYRGVGLQITAREEIRRDQVDTFGLRRASVYEYDAEGLRSATRLDLNDDGVWESQSEQAYDSLGRVTRVATVFEDIFGSQSREEWVTYDARGNRTEIRGEIAYGIVGDVVTLSRVTLDARDREDLRIEEVVGSDGRILSRTTIDTEYDARGNLRGVSYRQDRGADGTVDSLEEFTVEYDARDRWRSQVWEIDEDLDGVIDYVQMSTGTWSADDRSFVDLSTVDDDADGVAEALSETRYTLDARGQVTGVASTWRSGDDANFEQEDVFENDADGRPLVQISRYRYAGVGPSYVSTTRNQYDDAGNLVQRISERDDGGDGTVDARATITASIGAGGELLGMVYAGDWNWITGNEPTTLTTTLQTFTSGVAVLAQKYLTSGYAAAASVNAADS